MTLTKQEENWLRQLQKLLDKCPSDRLGFYTIGDYELIVYDLSFENEINSFMDRNGRSDFCTAVDSLNAPLGELRFPSQVHSTAG